MAARALEGIAAGHDVTSDSPAGRRSAQGGFLHRLPISFKLPFTAGALVLLIAAALVTAAYITMRSTSIQIADERLSALVKYFSESYTTATATQVTQLKALSNNDSLTGYLRSPTPTNRALALNALTTRSGGRGGSYALQLRSAQGDVLLEAGPKADRLRANPANADFPRIEAGDSVAAGRLRLVADSVVYPLVARIGGAEPSGYVVQWRQITTLPRLGDLMANLLGSEGAMYFANADGTVWTDFASVASAPSIPADQIHGLVRYTRPPPRGDVFAAAAPIAGTPWIWTVEFPARSVLGPSTAFLRRLIIVALCFVAFCLLVAWWFSRRLTDPLRELTAAADAIASGQTGLRIHTSRQDELGQLSVAFDAMAGQVDGARQELERRVAERTHELNLTLEQLRTAQESLVRREKLALLGQLASGVGHELRNPLGVMSNAIFYLQMVLAEAPDDVVEYLGILHEQVSLSGKIVTDLLDLTRVTPAQRQPIALSRIAEVQLQRVQHSNRVAIVQEFPDSLPLAEVDPVHAGQVVLNLMTNAVQAMGDSGGKLWLRGSVDPGGQLRLEVRDSGPGVSPDHAEKIFEPLFTTKARGIGLGLAVSRSLAQANGGDLLLDHTSGRGATFIFLMPAVGGAI